MTNTTEVPLAAVDVAYRSVGEHVSGITWQQMQTALTKVAPLLPSQPPNDSAKQHIDTLRRLANNCKDTYMGACMALVIEDLESALGLRK